MRKISLIFTMRDIFISSSHYDDSSIDELAIEGACILTDNLADSMSG